MLGAYVAGEGEFTWRCREVFAALEEGWLELEIGGKYPLADASRAHSDLEGRHTTGKLLLTTSG